MTLSQPLRVVLALLVWLATPVGAWLSKKLVAAAPGDGVNMFGLTPAQHQAVVVGSALGLVVAVAVWLLGRLGWRWLLFAWGCAAAVTLVIMVVPERWVGSWAGWALAVLPPVAAAVLTRPRPPELEG